MPPAARPSVSTEERPSSARPGRPLVMGILNLTPDSFYAGSRAGALDEAVDRALRMEEEGADLIDVGGESTRPGSEAVSPEEEGRRVLPVIEALSRRLHVPISVDTSKPEVAERALAAGASALNDVLALRGGPRMPEIAARFKTVVLMHMLGTSPKTMQESPRYGDVVEDILAFLRERLEAFRSAGGDVERAWIDPGIGFGKTADHNLEILRRLEELRALGRPVLVGASRKSFLGRLPGAAPLPPEERLEGSLAVACRAALAGVHGVRTHDVAATRRALEAWREVAP